MQKILPHLWFDDAAEAAITRYVSLIPGSAKGTVARYPEAGSEIHGRAPGSVMTVESSLGGTAVVALNGGPHFRFTPAISLFVVLQDEAAVDRFWEGLVDGGSVLMPLDKYDWSPKYGWLSDRWGLNWQVTLGNKVDIGRTVAPSLLFTGAVTGQAEAAMSFYTTLFDGSSVDEVYRYDGSGPDQAGTVMYGQFRLAGETLLAMDSAAPQHDFAFNEAVSLMALCEDQAEIDRLWSALSAVPASEQCGWLKDRFGVSWQIVPRMLGEMMTGGNRDQVERVTAAFMAMKKLDLPELRRAFAA
jgi:predicted 3-demethylubiquinone-9 3-methyltransferase (glyoxalase superfamily)